VRDTLREWGEVVNASRCLLETVGVLVVFNVARSEGLLGPPLVSACILSAMVALVAWRAGASLVELGLGRDDLSAGLRYGFAAVGVVLGVLVLAAVVPATNGFLHDSRAEIDGGALLYEVIAPIVLFTAIPEELAFRGVLLGAARQLWGRWRAVLFTSALFGLWHIAPTLTSTSDNRGVGDASPVLVVLAAVAATFVAGLLLGWLRLRSDSLIAPTIAHAATNGLALVVAWIAIR
jgi:membrane protease YdiL (CAAX protease family)